MDRGEARGGTASASGVADRLDWINPILTIMVFKLPRRSREEVQAMLALTDIDLKQTRFYQDVHAEGLEEGLQKGRQEGRQEGRREGEVTVLLRLIQLKFGPPDQTLRQRIAATDADTLLRWSERVLTARTLDEVLAD